MKIEVSDEQFARIINALEYQFRDVNSEEHEKNLAVVRHISKPRVDSEAIKKRFQQMLSRLFREADMDDDEFFNSVCEEAVMQLGGLDRLCGDIQTGINNGYTEDQQFDLLEALIVRGTESSEYRRMLAQLGK